MREGGRRVDGEGLRTHHDRDRPKEVVPVDMASNDGFGRLRCEAVKPV